MKLTDGKKIVEVVIRTWDGTQYGPDWSNDYFDAGSLKYDANLDAYIVDDVVYCIDMAEMDEQEGARAIATEDGYRIDENVDIEITEYYGVFDYKDEMVYASAELSDAINSLLNIRYGQIVNYDGDCELTTMGIYHGDKDGKGLDAAKVNLRNQVNELPANCNAKFENTIYDMFDLDSVDQEKAQTENYRIY